MQFLMEGARGTIRVGTSGWHYAHWRGPFYPDRLPAAEMLPYYARHFDCVEINNSFYKLPTREIFQAWRERVPPGFVFAVKGSRYITHVKRMKEPAEAVGRLLDRVEPLEEQLGPILFQLPPRWRCDAARLGAFLETLPEDRRFAFEFRDESWFDDAVFGALTARDAALCLYELAGRCSPRVLTASWVYVRLHGPGEAYAGVYTDEALAGWAAACRGWAGDGRDVYVFFDNDQLGYAAQNAARLVELLGGRRRHGAA